MVLWVGKALLHISCVYYFDLISEFYANMFHNTDKDLSTTILTVKGDRIILETESLASIMGIRDKGNTVTIDFNRESIDENPDWSYEETSNNLEIRPRPGD